MMNSRKTAWTLGHLVDVEYFLRERPLSSAQTARWYAEHVQGTRSDRDDAHRIFSWVEKCREEHPDSPGRWLTRVSEVLYAIGLVFLFVSGVGVARRILQFDGFVPINAFFALGVLAAVPLLLSVGALMSGVGAMLWRGAPGSEWGKQARKRLLLHIVVPVVERIHRGPEWTRSVRRWADTLWSRSGLYAKAIGWTGFLGLQLCGLVFGLGLFSGTLFKGAVDDLSFGWTTTSQAITAERVEAGVQAVAIPWSWLPGEWMVPTFDQVTESRYFKKEGVFGLEASALQSWFPFICAAIMVYSILPRLLLVLVGWVGLRRAFARLSFQDADSQGVLRHMRGQRLQVSGSAEETNPEIPPLTSAPHGPIAGVHALVHDDVMASISVSEVEEQLQKHIGQPVTCKTISLDVNEDRGTLQRLDEVTRETAIVLVMEGWRPCLEQTKDMIRAIRQQVGEQRLIQIALVGKPINQSSVLSAELFNSWKASLSELRDPFLEPVNLCPAHA